MGARFSLQLYIGHCPKSDMLDLWLIVRKQTPTVSVYHTPSVLALFNQVNLIDL